MHFFVLFVFIFSMGCITGWILEVFYRHFADPEKHWFNPGFCVGPWLPIYGIGLLVVFIITFLENIIPVDNIIVKRLLLFTLMAICMTLIELIAGILLLKCFNLRLWDYSNEKYNYKGYICLKFSIFWGILSAGYYFLLHPIVFNASLWLSKNVIFSFFIGMFFGIFLIDIIYSSNVVTKIKAAANDPNFIIKLEEVKEKITREKNLRDAKRTFFIFMLKENVKEIVNGNKTIN